MTIRPARRGALALGSGILLASALGRAARATELRIGWRKGGVVALLKGWGLRDECPRASPSPGASSPPARRS